MRFSLGEYSNIVKLHSTSLLIYLIGIILVLSISFIAIFNNHISYIESLIDKTYNNKIEYVGNLIGTSIIVKNKNNIVYNISKNKIKIKKTYLTSKLNLFLYNDKIKAYVKLTYRELGIKYISILLYFLPFSILIFTIPLLISVKREKEETIFRLAGNEALLANKSMINIAENIHHELNTPIEVIDNKIEKIKEEFYEILRRDKDNNKLMKLEEDFNFIKISSEQIYSVLEKMKEFKHLRYSNGNKTLRDIIDGGFKIINISNSNFIYNIDDKLDKFRLNSKLLKNADLLGIVLNHIKNSLEANASNILIILVDSCEDKTVLRIIDNGVGIPIDHQKNIFKANFSTKKSDLEIRGNGMYLNNYILNSVGGSISLIESSNRGTTLELTIPTLKVVK